MKTFRECVAKRIKQYSDNLSFFLLESILGRSALCDIAYAPIRTQSPQKPAAVYRSDP